jgi:hypothetical protein
MIKDDDIISIVIIVVDCGDIILYINIYYYVYLAHSRMTKRRLFSMS